MGVGKRISPFRTSNQPGEQAAWVNSSILVSSRGGRGTHGPPPPHHHHNHWGERQNKAPPVFTQGSAPRLRPRHVFPRIHDGRKARAPCVPARKRTLRTTPRPGRKEKAPLPQARFLENPPALTLGLLTPFSRDHAPAAPRWGALFRSRGGGDQTTPLPLRGAPRHRAHFTNAPHHVCVCRVGGKYVPSCICSDR